MVDYKEGNRKNQVGVEIENLIAVKSFDFSKILCVNQTRVDVIEFVQF